MAQMPPDTYSVTATSAALSFLRGVQARFAAHPSVYAEFRGLLTRYSKGETPDGRAVVARAMALLRGQPDLVDRFKAFHPYKFETEPAGGGTAAASPATGEDAAAANRRDSDRRRTDAVADADLARAVQFIKRLKEDGDGELQGRIVALLTVVRTEKIDSHEIYEQAVQIFGSAPDSDLLGGFIEYLPALHDVPRRIVKAELEKQRLKRKATAVPVQEPVPVPVAADAGKPSAAKKPRVVDDRKSRRTSIDGGGSMRGSGGRVSTFREAWEFETRYSKLVATMRRTKTLQKELDEPGPHAPRAFDDLFPGRECQEVLRGMYGARWEPIQEALEDGERTRVALGRIMDRLMEKEGVAVKAAMEQRDPARVRDRLLNELAILRRKNKANQEHR